MNRHERRTAQKRGAPPSGDLSASVQPVVPIVADAGKPGWALRIIAWILLSRFVLRRVSHPEVLTMLGEVARQARRLDALSYIQAKLPTAK